MTYGPARIDDTDRRVAAAGYDKGGEKSARRATGLDIAAVILEHTDVEGAGQSASKIVAGLEEAGFTDPFSTLRQQALEAVLESAVLERTVATGMTATASELPPPHPGPAPEGLGHPETLSQSLLNR